VLDNHKVLHL